jgi:hypothetical protein
MSETTSGRFEAAIVAIAPFFLLAALGYHPYIANLTDPSAVAGAMSADTTRWAVAHIAVGLGFGLMLIALLAVSSYLQRSGEERWSSRAVPFLVMGTTFFVFLPAFETAMIAASRVGADPVALQQALRPWFVPIMLSSALIFGIGVILLAAAVARSRAFDAQLTRVSAGALVVLALSRFVPLGGALYLGAVAGVVALVPIAIQMWSSRPSFGLGGNAAIAGGRGGAR